MSTLPALTFLAERLATRAELTKDDMQDVSALPFSTRFVRANTFIVREGETPRSYCALVVSGLAFRHKLTVEGARQIVSLHLQGDFLDLQHLFLNIADHSVQALTEMEIAEVDRAALQTIALHRPTIARALWIEALIDSSIYREWVLNVGRRDARARIAHLLCELAVRMHVAGILPKDRFELPMTQEQIGDATGLTGVHVNRIIRALAADGVIDQSGRWIAVHDWSRVRAIGDFNPLYLHLDQGSSSFNGRLSALFEGSDQPLLR